MKAQIIQIGNSQGIRIPKLMLEEARISSEVELRLQPDGILIKSASQPRSDWDEAFRELADNDDNELIETPSAGDFEKKEWKW
ncbi:MAG TPA: AbrB/MazE/SpoVT family DNA-binding domain-containing protein [Pyrinomonadaceae bacterium]|nr:AbrB/MazE/SpoVT family DNA-binding domain-containing protein [Pyrinomonadaceae bacterium]